MSNDFSQELSLAPEVISQVNSQICEGLGLLPNVRAGVGANGEIKVSPEQKIQNVRYGSWLTGEGKEEKMSEVNNGRRMIGAVSATLWRAIADDYLGLGLSFKDILVPEDAGDPIYRIIDLNYDLRDMLDLHKTNTEYRDLINKGYPPAVARVVVIATLQETARTIGTVVRQRAEEINQQYEENHRPSLEVEIKKLSSDIELKERELDETKSQAEKARKACDETASEVADLDRSKQKIIDFYNRNKVTDFDASKLPAALQIVEEKRGVLKIGAKLQIKGDAFAPLDAIRTRLEESTKSADDSFSSFEAFGTGPGSLLVQAVTDHLNSDKNKNISISLLCDEARQIASIIAGDSSEEISEKVTLIENLSKKDPDGAKQAAVGLNARLMTVYILTQGKENRGDLPSVAGDFVKHFGEKIEKTLESTEQYKKAAADHREAKANSQQAQQKVQETEALIQTLKNNLENNRQRLNELIEQGKERIDKAECEALAAILFSDQPNRGDLVKEMIASPREKRYKFYIRSKLFTDVVKAVFDGLPRCINGDSQVRPQIVDGLRGLISSSDDERGIKDYPDFLPPLINAMLPKDYPSPDLAATFIAEFLRRYPDRDGELSSIPLPLSGYPAPADYERLKVIRRQALPAVRAVIDGGRIVEIPPDVPRFNPRDKEETKKEEVITKLKKYLEGLGWGRSFLVSMGVLRHPDKRDGGVDYAACPSGWMNEFPPSMSEISEKYRLPAEFVLDALNFNPGYDPTYVVEVPQV